MTAPTPDTAAILAALPVLFTPDDVIELRAFPKGRKRTDAGYFDGQHWPQLAEQAARLSASGAAVYITLNPVDPQLLSRYNNRIEGFAQSTTTDKQVTRRRWLLVDIDPVRPSGTSATDAQLDAAKVKARAVYGYLNGSGWPAPLVAESGNGMHLLYAIDLPNDDEATALVKAVLVALGERFDDSQTKVDRAVFNAARICKLYGTLANKGDNTAAAPWRLSKLLQTPARAVVTPEQLRDLIPATTDSTAPTAPTPMRQPGGLNLEDFLSRHGLAYTTDRHDGSERFKLAACPFNAEHVNGEAAIFRKASGALGFKCQHDSCSAKSWGDVRDLLDGPRQARAPESDPARRGPAFPPLGDDAADTWPDPTPLPDALPPVQPFDPDLLPMALRGWVTDIAHRMQCPPDFPAVGAVVALSSLIGARAVVQPKARDDWQVVPNLWGLIVGRPGVMKSPALGESLKPLSRLQATEFEQWQAAHDAWELDCKVAELQGADREKKAKGLASKDPAAARALLEPGDTPAEPLARRYIVNDATVEKLGELLTANPWGTLSYRDELYGLLTGMDKQGQEGSRAFYLQSYDGNQGYTFDRIIRGTVHIPRVCLAMIGGIQPGRIQEYVRGAVSGGSADDGLLQRFGLAVWPDTNGEFVHVDQWPDTPAKTMAWGVFERLAQLQPASDTDPVIWRFDDAAQALFVEWRTPFEQELKRGELHPAMESHLAKYRKLIPALALVFALVDTPDSGGVIHERELIRALAWGDYLRTHAERLYAAAVIPETAAARALLTKIKGGKLTDRDGVIADNFTPRQIAVKGWAGLTTPDAVRKAADVLADYDWLRRDVVQSGAAGGRPSDRYAINPAMLGSGGTV
ncbi:MAG: DUF3987 domain-containing protein [Comamonadaceae bacterium]|jgi:putative DNA primase/helicase|nr:DUF3987 domain-containing protein [Comamonadaceae bacterium]MBH2044031.1 DUF3987 domain-containing protein [Comamonadaceae bacterium]